MFIQVSTALLRFYSPSKCSRGEFRDKFAELASMPFRCLFANERQVGTTCHLDSGSWSPGGDPPDQPFSLLPVHRLAHTFVHESLFRQGRCFGRRDSLPNQTLATFSLSLIHSLKDRQFHNSMHHE